MIKTFNYLYFYVITFI